MGRLFELKTLRILVKTIVVAATSSIWHARLGHPPGSRLGSLISSGCLGPVKQEHVDCVLCQISNIILYLLQIVILFHLLLLT